MYIDDVIWLFRDLTRQRPKSMFEHPFLATLKSAHDHYGLKVQLNCFYRTDVFYGMDEFSLAEMTAAYKGEWQASKDWLRLGFHAYQEFPDYPFINASYDDVAKVFDRICGEVRRFAGDGVFAFALVGHWLPVSKAGCRALKDRGVKLIASTDGARYEYGGDRSVLPYGHAMRVESNRTPECALYRRTAALPEPEKPTGPTDADVRRLADEIKSLKRPPTMTEVRDYAQNRLGRTAGRVVYSLLRADWSKYGLEVIVGDSLAEKLVVPIKNR